MAVSSWWHANRRKISLVVAGLVVLIAVGRLWSHSPTSTTGGNSTSSSRVTVSTSLPPSAVPTSLPPSTVHPSTPSTPYSLFPPSSVTTAEASPATEGSVWQARVATVVDGDTLRVQIKGDGEEKVRLIGIDAPEEDEPFFDDAKQELVRLVKNQTVLLELDVEERDRYGRLLAYVWLGDKLINAELLRLGVATVYTLPPNVKHVDLLSAAQDEAQSAGRGMWGAQGDSPVKILEVNYNAPGNDNYNLNEEYVVFEGLVSGTLLDYSVQDEAGHRYRFPDVVFKEGDVFRLRSGKGKDTHTDLYWGAEGSAIWNNSGDTVKVLDPQDRIVESYRY